MSAILVGRGETYGFEPELRGFWCTAHLTGESCRAEVGLCDLCVMDLCCLLEAFVPLLVPALRDHHFWRSDSAGPAVQALDQALIGGVGLLFDPVEQVPHEGRAWELLREHYPEVRTTEQLAAALLGRICGDAAAAVEPAVVPFAREVRAAVLHADAVLRRQL